MTVVWGGEDIGEKLGRSGKGSRLLGGGSSRRGKGWLLSKLDKVAKDGSLVSTSSSY